MHFLGRGRVVITGGAGFIGSALVWALNLRGIDDILIVDRLDQSEKWKNLVPLRYRDYMDASDFESALLARPGDFTNVGTLLHLGACSSTTETDTAFLMRNNYEYSKHLAQWAIARDVRFVYASSAATYGGLERNLRDDSELDALRPLNMYAYSKHRFDLFARDNGWLDKITGLKYFNVFGPNEQHKGDMRSLVDKAFHQIQETRTIRLFKSYRSEYRDGEQRRDFLYVKDAAEMTLHLADREAYGLFNLGSGQAHTWLDLVRPIFRALRVPERIEFVEMPAQLRDKYQYCTCATIDRLRAAGYERPVTALDRAVDDYVSNYLLPGHGLDPAQAESSAALNRSA
jgi:ADP-L-glycero-D-manno-heptose 6-epimerase